jgi:diguanylate cyclase (GGDEF)-like protein
MALLAVVPLTLLEGLAFACLLGGFFLIAEAASGTLQTLHSLGDLWLLLLLAAIAMWVQMSQLHMLLRLYREATRDALTGLVNRRVLNDMLRQEVDLGNHADRPLSLLLFDLDLFKRINDTWGHHAGDSVLQTFAGILRRHCRDHDLVGRFGGEEFLAILPGADVEDARTIAEDIRRVCALSTVKVKNSNEQITFTTSIGVAALKPGERAHELLARVDESLYQAKAAGRDIVSIAE